MKNLLKKATITAAATLSLGGLVAVGVESAAPPKAEAYIGWTTVAKSSDRGMRLCNGQNGKLGCSTFKPGAHAVHVGSARQDAGCEYWENGKKKFNRVNKSVYRNYVAAVGKKTLSLENCRNTGRGDVAPKN